MTHHAANAMTAITIATATLLLSLLNVPPTFAHVGIKVPASRLLLIGEPNWLGAQGLGGSGPALCGGGTPEPGQSAVPNTFGKIGRIPPENRFRAGQVATFQIALKAAHKGRYRFRICQHTGAETTSTVNVACFEKHRVKLVFDAAHVFAGNAAQRLPRDDFSWWISDNPSSIGAEENPRTLFIKVVIPSGLNCDGVNNKCVLQFDAQSGYLCNPKLEIPSLPFLSRPNCPAQKPPWCVDQSLPPCRVETNQVFRHCADIIVTP